jgi:succinylglutamic semialdehyde dehydrogenase
VLFSAFVTAGQRCTAVSRVVVERSIADRFAKALVAGARKLVVGHPKEAGVFMGPIATEPGFEKFAAAQALATSEGDETLLATEEPDTKHRGYYVRPSIHRVAKPSRESRYQQLEIFGPDVAIFVADDVDHAIAIADDTPYGLAAGVFTTDEAKFEKCAKTLKSGCIAWNAPTVGSSSKMPFGGVKNSGNHRPAALFSTLYCTWPVAITRGAVEVDVAKMAPGMGFEPR